ncbi:hypothetical protein ED28_03260 [[Pantoea] beijingensis]|uniref:Sugar phosphate isomerase/epimerase n=1 Tax=[Pantoea] beijingensis TaxID=1324864 RepID=A0A443IGZ5_9GAMM|nr:sugar phosphate isomerase/epimerase [[Pantoea] beijingensis]RWR03329.1 hypothetical protein ED28_03260 [[Pantoea] beijingensis]
MTREIIVVTAAYGHQTVQALGGQQALLPIIAEAGADGVEIRRELMSEEELRQCSALGQTIADHQLTAFYSVPAPLFSQEGRLNPDLDNYLHEAQQLNAQILKFSLGHYQPGFDFAPLRQQLAGHRVHLVVENDQTVCGRQQAINAFFAESSEIRMPIGMTFDMANWLWAGEDATAAASSLKHVVSYIHVKAAIPHHDTFRAIALDDADRLWRDLLRQLPTDVPRGIEFPLEGDDLVAVTRHYVNLLREE